MKKPWLSRYLLDRSLKFYTSLILSFLILCIVYIYYIKESLNSSRSHLMKERFYNNFNDFDKPNLVSFNGERIVHIDLKGAPPKVSYYKKLFPLLSKLGATGILIEYEDMFPYYGSIIGNISAFNAYSLDDIKTINKLAMLNKLKVIPLLQTFGHLEFILKLDEFQDLREVIEYPQVICPTHKRTREILIDMIDQVIQAHPNSKIIHIGADEVYYLGVCDRCSNTMIKYNLNKNMLFLDHINAIVDAIHRKYPLLKILMWDDEFRSFTLKELKTGYLNNAIEPVIWKYSKDVYEELGPTLWNMYRQVFRKIWVGSAFKGATGSNQYVSDVTHYVQNHRSWMNVMNEYQDHFQIEGIIITGWQRYDHFAILCELLPVSLPSLAMSLRVILGYNDSPFSPPTEVAKILGCEQPFALIGPVFGSPKCSYPGGDILENVLHLQQLKQEYETILEDSRVKGWMDRYNIVNRYSNPQLVQSVTIPLNRIRDELILIDLDITTAMFEVYDNFTISEWKETYLKPFEKQINHMCEAREKLLGRNSWPRRPLAPPQNEL